MGVELLRRYVSSSMRICYRSVVKHPFLVGMILFLISMYRLFPLLFSLLVSASPVIVSTAVLLGTLLSLGQPNIPEIEKEEKSDPDEIQNLETRTEIDGRDGSFASEETNGSKIEVGDESIGEKTSVHDDNHYVEVNTPVGLVDDSVLLTEQLQFVEEHLMDEAQNEERVILGNRYSQLQQSEDEHVVLESDDKLREGFADPINSDSVLLWKRAEGDDDDDDEGYDSGSDLAESSSPDASMADIIPMLDELHPLLSEEHDAPQPAHLSHDDTDAASEHSLESSESSSESNDDNGIENHEDLEAGDDEEDDSKHANKEDETSPAITWTEDDQKNLMDLGTSELERNQRLENLIARRRARKAMRMQAEKNLIDLESADIPWNIPPISTTRNNPFDISYDSNNNVPGSAPSVLLPRRNPFDLPYDSNEEKPDLVGDTFQQDFAGVQVQPKELFFRRHESFNVGPSIFGASRQERQETKLRPYFVPERIASDVSSFSSFQRQFSDLSDSKVSSVPDSESIGSAGDLENKDHIEDAFSQEAELISEKDHEHNSGIREHPEVIYQGEHALEEREHVSEHVSQGSESSEDDDVESIQVVRGEDSLGEAIISVGDVTDQQLASEFPEPENVAPSMEVMSIHLNLDDQELHSSASSISSSDEVSEQIYNEKEGDEMEASVSETTYHFVDRGNSSVSETTYHFVDRGNSIDRSHIDITSLVVEESQPKEPVYDSSPRAVTKNLSSSSISTDLQVDISERGLSPSILEKTDSFPGIESQETMQKVETDYPGNDAEFVDSSEDIGSRSIIDHDLNESELNLGSSMGEDNLHKDESFQHTEDQLQSSSPVADVKGDAIDSSSETRYAEDQLPILPDNEEPLLFGNNISSSLPILPLPETEDSLLDMEASHQVEQVQVPSSIFHARSDEDIHEEEVISQPAELSLLDRPMDTPLVEDPEEPQDYELERDQVTLANSEAQPPEVVLAHGETYENPGPIHHQLLSEENAISQPERVPFLDTFTENTSDPEVPQVQITSNHLDNLPFHESENDVSLNTNSTLSAEPVVVEVSSIKTKAPENPAYESDMHGIENNDDVDDIKEIDEDLLVELDAVGDFSVNDLGSILGDIKQDPHAPEHDLEMNHSGDEDSYSNDLGTTLNKMERDPHASKHDLETDCSGDEKDTLGSNLNEMKQGPHASKNDLVTNLSGDEDSSSKDLGSTLNEMKEDPHASELDLETNHSGDDDDSYLADVSETKLKIDAEDMMKSQNLKESSNVEVAGVSEAENEVALSQKTESSTLASTPDKE